MKKKLILHVPHSSIKIPISEGFIVNIVDLEKEILRLTDWYTDDLFYSHEDEMIIADFSRIFCDPERFTDDSQEIMSQSGMGVLYEKSDEGRLIRKVSRELKEKILNEFYRPHHSKLNDAVNFQLIHFDKALIIDCHSFPSFPLTRDLDQNPARPDFNIGTDQFHTPKHLTDFSAEFFTERCFTIGVDYPYKGTIVPLEHYNKNKNVHSIMLEINRKLYLKEPTNKKSANYEVIKNIIREFLCAIKNFF
jgi:N-formylglutamate amidohydrolase